MTRTTADLLFKALGAYGSEGTSYLKDVEAQYRDEAGYIDGLILLAEAREGKVSDAATWLLKSHLDQGGVLSPPQTEALLKAMETIESWSAKLHICQAARRLDIGEIQAVYMAHWLTPLLQDDRPFIRAWALDALWHLALKHPGFRDDADVALRHALDDSAASVRARARDLQG